jgi:hypothetical protein
MANQYETDPRQVDFLKAYLDRQSDTFANAYQSAIKVGYSEEYAKTIVSRDLEWVSDAVRDEELIQISDKNLKELLTQDKDLKVKADLTKFVKSRLQKDKWSERQELTGKYGENLQIQIINYADSNTIQLPSKGISNTTPQSD